MRLVIRTSNKDPLILLCAMIGFALLARLLVVVFPDARGWVLDVVVLALFFAAATCLVVLFLCLVVIAFGQRPEASSVIFEEEPPC